jgi:TRAP-type uncharacterized transport system fused permease subunit
MGLPTTANYIVTSTIIAPALIKMDVLPLAAHMFVFYFGIMADLTPPVCLAAFTGAGIAGANPGKTGLEATKIALVAYALPYTFIYTPAILLEQAQPLALALIIVAALAGIIALAGALQGWLVKNLAPWMRGLLIVPGLAAFLPNSTIKLASLAMIAVLVAWVCLRAKKPDLQGA